MHGLDAGAELAAGDLFLKLMPLLHGLARSLHGPDARRAAAALRAALRLLAQRGVMVAAEEALQAVAEAAEGLGVERGLEGGEASGDDGDGELDHGPVEVDGHDHWSI